MDLGGLDDAQFDQLMRADFSEFDMMCADQPAFNNITAAVASISSGSPPPDCIFSDEQATPSMTSPLSLADDDPMDKMPQLSKDPNKLMLYDSNEALNMLHSLYPGLDQKLPFDFDLANAPAQQNQGLGMNMQSPFPSFPSTFPPLQQQQPQQMYPQQNFQSHLAPQQLYQQQPQQPPLQQQHQQQTTTSTKRGSPPSNKTSKSSSSNIKPKSGVSTFAADSGLLSDVSNTSSPVMEKTTPGGQKRKKTETKDDDSDDEHLDEGMTTRVLPWTAHDQHINYALCDYQLQPVTLSRLSVSGDKGFSYSIVDEAFVCQKKNHFQVSLSLQFYGRPTRVMTDSGPRDIARFVVGIKAIKTEMPDKVVLIEQAQTDRSKKHLPNLPLDVIDGKARLMVPRLHFSETTANNIRRKGKPNPDQRFFYLVVQVFAESQGLIYQIAAERSEPLIVRASNVGLLETAGAEVDTNWTKGKNSVISHHGNVGINTDNPTDALAVHGNIRVTGTVVHPSDKRIKEDITLIDPAQQLENVKNIKLYNYNLTQDWADTAGRTEKRTDMGVLAQEVAEILPSAVIKTGDVTLNNGKIIEDLLVVNKDRIFLENVGAVQQLSKVTDCLDQRIQELEELNASLIITSKIQKSTLRREYTEELKFTPIGFPWLRLLCYIGIALMVASVMAIAVVIGITQTSQNGASTITTTTTTSAPYSSLGFFPAAVLALIQSALTIQTTCPGGCPSSQTCVLGTCQCLYGIGIDGRCLNNISNYCSACDPNYSICELGGSTNFSCVCHPGWTGDLCLHPVVQNTYLSQLRLTDPESSGATWTMTPSFNIDVSEYFFNISSSPAEQFNLYLSSTKVDPATTWTIRQYVFYSCAVPGPGFSPLGPNTAPFAANVPISVDDANLLYIEVVLTAAAVSTSAPPSRAFSLFFAHNCNATFS